MLELAVTSAHGSQIPAISFDQLEQFPHFHPGSIPSKQRFDQPPAWLLSDELGDAACGAWMLALARSALT